MLGIGWERSLECVWGDEGECFALSCPVSTVKEWELAGTEGKVESSCLARNLMGSSYLDTYTFEVCSGG